MEAISAQDQEFLKDLSDPSKNLTRDELEKVVLDLAEKVEAVKKKAYQVSFWLFTKEVAGWKDLYEPLHKRVCDFVQQNIKDHNLLLLLPRGTFKSSVVTVTYPLWRIAQDPNVRIMIGNATYPMATSFVGQMQNNIQKNQTFIEYFGDLYTNTPLWREDKFTVNNATGIQSKEATVTAFGITSNFVGSHYDVAILDDLVNRENSKTKDGLLKPVQFYKDTLDLVDPGPNGRRPVIVIGTTWHQYDLYGWLQDKTNPASKEFKTLRLPAYEGEWGKGKLLFPKRLSWEALEKQKRQQGPSHFSAQYMLNPVPSDTAIFKTFKYYEEEDIKGLKLHRFIAVDPAIGSDSDSDYSAMICVGVDSENNWYILDLWRERVRPSKLIDMIFLWDAKWKPITTALEVVAFQKMLRYQLEIDMKTRNTYIPIKEVRHANQTKLQRILGLEPRYFAGKVFHNQQVPFNDDFELELKGVTPEGVTTRNDDIIDALATINEIAFPPKRETMRRSSIIGKGHKGMYPA